MRRALTCTAFRSLPACVPPALPRPYSALATLALLLAPWVGVGAQSSVAPQGRAIATATPPDFQTLRFDEDWSHALSGQGDWVDRLKAIPLGGGGRAVLRLGGQLRARAEAVENYQLGSGSSRRDDFGVTRESLWGDLRLGAVARGFVELRNAQAVSRDLPGGARTSDYDLADLENAFVELDRGEGPSRALLRVGRQEISWGRERVLGASDWTNSRTTYEGLDARWPLARATVGALVVRPVTVRSRAPDLRDTLTLYRGAYLDGAPAGPAAEWQLYALRLDDRDAVRAGVPGDRHELTTGGRVVLAAPASPWSFEGEGALERGRLTDTPVRAWFVASELAYARADWRAAPRLSAGLDWASGGGDSTRLATYAPPATTGHSHAGYMDILGRANLADARAGLALRPARALSVQATQHWFWRASADGAAFAKSMAVLRAADPTARRALGGETDVTGALRLTRRLRVEAGIGYFAPGAFLLSAPSPARPSTWTFLSTSYLF